MSKGVKCVQDGYRFTYFEKPGADKALLIIGQDKQVLIKACAKYFNSLGVSFVAIGSNPTGKAQPGVHSLPLECIESVIKWLRARHTQGGHYGRIDHGHAGAGSGGVC